MVCDCISKLLLALNGLTALSAVTSSFCTWDTHHCLMLQHSLPHSHCSLVSHDHHLFVKCVVQGVREGEREVRELVAGRERDERAISLATPYYDVVRRKHGESDEEAEEASEVAVDYLTQFLPLVTGTRSLNRQEALEVRERSLKVGPQGQPPSPHEQWR